MPASTNKSANSKCRWTGWGKNQDRCVEAKRALIESGHPDLSIVQQCELLDLARSSYYYQPVGESEENLLLMRLLDEQYTRTPFYGTRRMTAWLHTQGYAVNRKRVTRLLRTMGLEAIYPKPHLSQAAEKTQRYPYLLRGSRLSVPTRSGAVIAPTSAWLVALSIWWRSWIGSVGMCSPGKCQ